MCCLSSSLFPYTTLFRSISLAPEFRIDRAVFIEAGGIYCVPNLRGGGEYGEDWHKAGTKCSKQNVLDRKSTRLNSSHLVISYAVFCVKKKIIIIYIFVIL